MKKAICLLLSISENYDLTTTNQLRDWSLRDPSRQYELLAYHINAIAGLMC
jgi:hypothetical protein